MSKDLKLTYLLVPIDVTDVVWKTKPSASADGVVYVRSKMGGLSKTVDVRLFGSSVPFQINSDTELEVTVDTEDLSTLEVWAEATFAGYSQQLRMMVGPRPQQVEGLMKLVQQFVFQLLKVPGTDVFDPEDGGGLGDLLDRFLSGVDQAIVGGEVNRAVKQASAQIVRKQRTCYLPPEERLVGVDVLGIDVRDNQGAVSVYVFLELHSAAGQAQFGMQL